MLLAIHLPDAVFIYLAYAQPTALPLWFSSASAVRAVRLRLRLHGVPSRNMMAIARADRTRPRTTPSAPVFMALGMMIPGLWSGWLADHLGYRHFFTWVIFATIPSFLVAL